MISYLAVTVIADDRPGIIEKIAEKIKANGGNWLESNMSRLAGKFAGILLISVAAKDEESLTTALKNLQNNDIRIQIETSNTSADDNATRITIHLMANDRPGIIAELSALFARNQINVEELATWCESAPMSAELLFKAVASVAIPENLSLDDLTDLLESLSDDLVVEFET